jgi:hypothetical protein
MTLPTTSHHIPSNICIPREERRIVHWSVLGCQLGSRLSRTAPLVAWTVSVLTNHQASAVHAPTAVIARPATVQLETNNDNLITLNTTGF